jgi:hypothetical protein
VGLYLLFGLGPVKLWGWELNLVEEAVYEGVVGLGGCAVGYEKGKEVVLEGFLKGLKGILWVFFV